jgi:hypothetical protein
MLSSSKKIDFQYYFFNTLALLFFINITPAQEKKIILNIKATPVNSNYWMLENNNFGIKPSPLNLQARWQLKTSNSSYLIDILLQKEVKKYYINESFVKYNFSDHTFLRLGKYYRDFSNYLNNDLSSGSMLISHNAQSMPKIGFVTSKKMNEKITFNFGIAHGLFEKNDTYTKAPFLHEKFIYIDIKKNDYEFGIGLVHEAIWAGEIASLGKQPNKVKDFFKVFISADGPRLEGEPHANALGNHLGIWDFYYKKQNEEKLLKLYYQHFFEDTSGLRFTNRIDGLWGVELENYIPKTNLLIEYLTTEDQDRTIHNDAYYNHYQYNLGWSYKGYALGNPFINYLKVEPVKVFHLGLSGKIYSKYYYQFKVAKKINIGDKIKYKLVMTKEFDEKNYPSISDLNIYIMNNENMKNGLGISISYKL